MQYVNVNAARKRVNQVKSSQAMKHQDIIGGCNHNYNGMVCEERCMTDGTCTCKRLSYSWGKVKVDTISTFSMKENENHISP